MASPPPILPSLQLSNPRKRPSLTTSSLSSSAKRRKASIARNPSQLRQTSFPPDDEDAISISGSVVMSPMASGALSPPAYSPSAPRSREMSMDAASVRSGGTATLGSVKGKSKRGNKVRGSIVTIEAERPDTGNEEGDDEIDEDDEDGDVLEGDEENTNNKEKEARSVLANRMEMERDGEHLARYNAWHYASLKKDLVKRLVNHTLSQSVPNSVVTSVMGAIRIFAGELIDSACEVRKEWQTAADKLPTGEMLDDDEPIAKRKLEEYRGPLTPDHLREALRRLKKTGDGGSVGLLGLSLTGSEFSTGKTGGRRLFK